MAVYEQERYHLRYHHRFLRGHSRFDARRPMKCNDASEHSMIFQRDRHNLLRRQILRSYFCFLVSVISAILEPRHHRLHHSPSHQACRRS